MATSEMNELNELVPYLLKHKNIWTSYDEEADVLYLHFKQPNYANHSEMHGDDTIVRYADDEVIGITILNASQR